jgi:hypothetical protein
MRGVGSFGTGYTHHGTKLHSQGKPNWFDGKATLLRIANYSADSTAPEGTLPSPRGRAS